jgi:hypothetical protein
LEAGVAASVAYAAGHLPGAVATDATLYKSPSTTPAPGSAPVPSSSNTDALSARGTGQGGPSKAIPANVKGGKAGGNAAANGSGHSVIPHAPPAADSSDLPFSIPALWHVAVDPPLACGLPASEVAAATGAGTSLAALSALQSSLHEEGLRLVCELWARCAYAAGVLAQGTLPGTDSDRNLLALAQRCAAACIALVPPSNLACDELGGVFGLRGHGYDAYGLAALNSDSKAARDEGVGQKTFRSAFLTTPVGGVVAGTSRGGRSSVFQWWSIAEIAWGRAVLLLIDPGSQSVSERDHVSDFLMLSAIMSFAL